MISNLAFAVSVCVFLGIAFAQHALMGHREKPGADGAWRTTVLLGMNHCLVYGDALLRERYIDYRRHFNALISASNEALAPFQGFAMGSDDLLARAADASPCPRYLGRLGQASGPLDASADAYVKAYDDLRPDAREAERLYAQARPDTLAAHHLDHALERGMETLAQRALPFRQALEQPQLTLRTSQLEAIEQRLGRDQHWLTLNFMLLARQAIDQLDQQAEARALRSEQVRALHARLAASWSLAEDFQRAHPRLRSTNGGTSVWRDISQSAQAWLDTLDSLAHDWQTQATPGQLSQDFTAMGQGYDHLVNRYNGSVRNQY